MKSIIASVLSILLLDSFGQTADRFIVQGDVRSVDQRPAMVYFSYKVDGKEVKDSAVVQNDTYVLQGRIHEPVMLLMNAGYADTGLKYDYRRDYKVMHVAPGDRATIVHSDSFSTATIRGSIAQEAFENLEAKRAVYNQKINSLWKDIELLKSRGDTSAANQKLAEVKALAAAMNALYPTYIKEHPASPIGLFVLNQYKGPFLDPGEIEPLFNILSPTLKNSYTGKLLQKKIELAKRTAVGNMAPMITQQDSSGKSISLQALKGKYVLIEFWASWCQPCRVENPNLVRMYSKYRDRGFEIFGISVDVKRKNWLNAIKKDGLIWINTSNLLSMDDNPAALAFGVEAIPSNYLIDPEGRIIARNLRGPNLETKLQSLFY